MSNTFSHHSINHMITALSLEMKFPVGKPRADTDTLFIGGPLPGASDRVELANFGLRKKYKIIYSAFDAADISRGPVAFHVVLTDGLTETATLQDGRLWKENRRAASILVFSSLGLTIRTSSKGRLVVRDMTGRHHDHGYDLAMDALKARAGRRPGRATVLSSIGSLPTVLDIRTLAGAFANAA